MKKFISVFLAVLMIITMVPITVFSEELIIPSTDLYDYLSQDDHGNNTLIMATSVNFPPFEYIENGNYVGIDIEIAEKIAEKLGMTLEIKDIEFDSIINGVETGKYDIGIAAMTVTESRLASVNFSSPYLSNVQVVIVAEDSSITSLDDLRGDGSMKFGVQQNTTSDIYVSDKVENGGYGAENVVRYKTGADAVQALKSGNVDAVIIDSELAKSFVAADNKLRILDDEYCFENYAIAIAKENTALLGSINNALSELKSDGTINRILEKYISVNEINTSGTMTNGKCGDNLTWTLYNDGELVIRGMGDMNNFLNTETIPWLPYKMSIKKITITNGVTSIGDFAFDDFDMIENIILSDSVTCIGEYAFHGCDRIINIIIPKNVMCIHQGAFSYCSNLECIVVDKENLYYSSDEYGVLFNKDKTELLDYPEGNNLTEYKIPNSVTTISDWAFCFSTNLTNITISENVRTINWYVFNDCTNLTQITIHDKIEIIGDGAFGDCGNLETVYYTGTENMWNDIFIDENNECLINANIVFIPNPNDPEKPCDDITMKVYSSLPNLNVGKDQEIRFAVSLFETDTQIESKNGYSVIINDNAYLELTESYKSGKDQIFVFKGKKEGNTKVSFIENDTKIQKDLTIYISDDCRYFRCENENQPGERWISSVCITDFSCTQNNDGTQNIKFNAYNTNYSYATVEVFDQNGTFLKSIAIPPKTDASGMEKVINAFKYVYVDITDHSTPWYKKEANSQHKYISLNNLPKNSTIRITSDGKKSSMVTLYTGIDLFVNVVMLASGIEISKDAQKASVSELVKSIVENMPENALKTLASELSTAMLNSSTKEATENTYTIIFNMFSDIGINYKKILTGVLSKMGYGALDSIVTTLVPYWKIVTAVDDITAIGWELLSYSSFEYNSGEIKIYIANHGLENMLIENGISISQNAVFSKTTILDAYVVEDSDELKNLYGSSLSGVVYNITLRDNGKEIQPNGSIEVRIPIPKDMDGTKCVVYRLETDGTKTKMLTHLDDDYLLFTTDHLSYYEIVSHSSLSLGDVNSDGKITAADARLALRISAQIEIPTETQLVAADLTGDGKVTAADARKILRISAGLETI